MANEVSLKLNLSAEDRKRLEDSGVHLFYGEIANRNHSLREVARICDFAEAWLRTMMKDGKVKAFKVKDGNRTVWAMKAADVAVLRQEQADKHLNRLNGVRDGKKYTYRRPTEWAAYLMTKAVNDDKILKPTEKKIIREALKRYKVDWDKAYAERVAKKEANKAAKEAKKQQPK
jgi:hypothetical protein